MAGGYERFVVTKSIGRKTAQCDDRVPDDSLHPAIIISLRVEGGWLIEIPEKLSRWARQRKRT
jgi:hypothetical protein